MAKMVRIRRHTRRVKSAMGPGALVMTDDGLLGRVRRLIENADIASPTHVEIDDIDGGIALVSPQDIRLVFG